MTKQEIIDILKECEAFLEGHFLLSSGLHSGGYCQCAKLLRYPDKAAAVLAEVTAQVEDLGITKVCGPAMGGIVVSYELARQLGIESIFTERKDGVMQLRRGFTAAKGDRILISEDVVTTGKSTLETVDTLTAMGAEVVGVACIADRTKGESALNMPIYSAVKLDFPTYTPEECPLCAAGMAIVKPGSRAELRLEM